MSRERSLGSTRSRPSTSLRAVGAIPMRAFGRCGGCRGNISTRGLCVGSLWICASAPRAQALVVGTDRTLDGGEWIGSQTTSWENFRHPEHGYFVQSRGSTELDAALLMMPLVRFVSASDPVWLCLTLDAIRDQLSHEVASCSGIKETTTVYKAARVLLLPAPSGPYRVSGARRPPGRGAAGDGKGASLREPSWTFF